MFRIKLNSFCYRLRPGCAGKLFLSSVRGQPRQSFDPNQQCCGADPFFTDSGFRFFFRLRLQVKNIGSGSGSTQQISAPTGSKKQVVKIIIHTYIREDTANAFVQSSSLLAAERKMNIIESFFTSQTVLKRSRNQPNKSAPAPAPAKILNRLRLQLKKTSAPAPQHC